MVWSYGSIYQEREGENLLNQITLLYHPQQFSHQPYKCTQTKRTKRHLGLVLQCCLAIRDHFPSLWRRVQPCVEVVMLSVLISTCELCAYVWACGGRVADVWMFGIRSNIRVLGCFWGPLVWSMRLSVCHAVLWRPVDIEGRVALALTTVVCLCRRLSTTHIIPTT